MSELSLKKIQTLLYNNDYRLTTVFYDPSYNDQCLFGLFKSNKFEHHLLIYFQSKYVIKKEGVFTDVVDFHSIMANEYDFMSCTQTPLVNVDDNTTPSYEQLINTQYKNIDDLLTPVEATITEDISKTIINTPNTGGLDRITIRNLIFYMKTRLGKIVQQTSGFKLGIIFNNCMLTLDRSDGQSVDVWSINPGIFNKSSINYNMGLSDSDSRINNRCILTVITDIESAYKNANFLHRNVHKIYNSLNEIFVSNRDCFSNTLFKTYATLTQDLRPIIKKIIDNINNLHYMLELTKQLSTNLDEFEKELHAKLGTFYNIKQINEKPLTLVLDEMKNLHSKTSDVDKLESTIKTRLDLSILSNNIITRSDYFLIFSDQYLYDTITNIKSYCETKNILKDLSSLSF